MGRFHRGNNYGESSDDNNVIVLNSEEPEQLQLDMLREMIGLHFGPHWLDVLNKNVKE